MALCDISSIAQCLVKGQLGPPEPKTAQAQQKATLHLCLEVRRRSFDCSSSLWCRWSFVPRMATNRSRWCPLMKKEKQAQQQVVGPGGRGSVPRKALVPLPSTDVSEHRSCMLYRCIPRNLRGPFPLESSNPMWLVDPRLCPTGLSSRSARYPKYARQSLYLLRRYAKVHYITKRYKSVQKTENKCDSGKYRGGGREGL